MATLFISDLHLSDQQPVLTSLFLDFLQHQAQEAEALYILGDLFETWIGDDNTTPFNQKIVAALAALTAHGVNVYFMPGNRDFLIGEQFIEKTGCKLLTDPSYISLYGIPTLLSHGDSWCTLDKRYVYFRRLTRTRFLQWLFLKLPLAQRQKVAAYLRGKNHPIIPDNTKYDVVMTELVNYLQQHPAQLIIHGHTHQPCIQLFQQKNELKPFSHFIKRYVLSDWHSQQGNLLKFSANGEGELLYFSQGN
jgi:UDP-2,3-diacylglucosamine hydrolase